MRYACFVRSFCTEIWSVRTWHTYASLRIAWTSLSFWSYSLIHRYETGDLLYIFHIIIANNVSKLNNDGWLPSHLSNTFASSALTDTLKQWHTYKGTDCAQKYTVSCCSSLSSSIIVGGICRPPFPWILTVNTMALASRQLSEWLETLIASQDVELDVHSQWEWRMGSHYHRRSGLLILAGPGIWSQEWQWQ